MKRKNLMSLTGCALLLIAGFGKAVAQGEKKALTSKNNLSFDSVAQEALPKGWMVEATNPKGKLAEWKVIVDPDAPSEPNVLSITRINDTSSGVFNLCWTSEVVFQDGIIEVMVRANTGEEDQGGGLIWRVKDSNNYYVARYNPLEHNFRLYYVKNGARKKLADAGKLDIKTGEWFTMRILHRGDKIEGWLNGEKHFEVTDKTFMRPGGVGLWTKADAATSFDDFSVKPIEQS